MLKRVLLPARSFIQSFGVRSRHELSTTVAKYHKHGDPLEVLKVKEEELVEPKASEVVVKALATPINPADINMVQGTYMITPPLPAVGGNEGVFEVVQCGKNVTKHKVGDRVVPSEVGLGTWASYLCTNEHNMMRISNDVPIAQAAMICVNPLTALRMLRDFIDLEPGDTVVQNCANSAVGESVIQLCQIFGLQSINIVRDRPDLDSLKQKLKSLGATHVLTDKELSDSSKELKTLKPRLALNAVGGKAVGSLTRILANEATIVTYGGMSKQPVITPTSAFIFKDLTLRGFWLTRWKMDNSNEDMAKMIDEVAGFMKDGGLKLSYQMIPFSDFSQGLTKALEGYRDGKVLLTHC